MRAVKRKGRIKAIVAALTLIALWLTTLWPAFKPGYSFAVFQDNEYLLGPVFSHMSNAIGEGAWPVWMNTIMGGVPLYNTPQFSPWYPFYFLLLPLYQTALSAIHDIHWVVLLHILIIEINTYLLLRAIPVSRPAAILGAALLAFSANMLSYATWLNIVAPYAWLPLYVCALIRLFRAGPAGGSLILGIAAMTLLVLASPAQALIHSIFITAVYVAYQFVLQRRRDRMHVFTRGVLRLSMVAATSVLLSAPAFLPAVLDFNQMIRWIGPFPPVIGHSRIPFEAFLIDQLRVGDLGGALFPIERAREVGNEYMGLFPLSLAAFALFSRRRAHIALPFALMMIYAFLSSTGAHLGLAYINYHLPLLNMLREPSRFLFVFVFATSILAAIGFDHLRACAARGFRKAEWVVVIVLAVTASALIGLNYGRLLSIEFSIAALIVWFGTIIIIALSGLLRWTGLGRRSAIFGFMGLTLYFNYHFVPWVPPSIDSGHYLSADNQRLHEAMKRVAALDPKHDFRVIIDGSLDKQRGAMIGSFYGVRTFNSYFNPLPYKQFQEMYYHGPRKDNYFRVLGGRYLVCRDCSPSTLNGYFFVGDVAGIQIFETEDVSPYYCVKNSVDGFYKDERDFAKKVNLKNLQNGVLFVAETHRHLLGLLQTNAGEPSNCTIREEARTLNRLVVSLNCTSQHVFILNEHFGGQWRASLNGIEALIFRVNGNQIGVMVASGASQLEIMYAPKKVEIAIYALVAGILLLSAILYRFLMDRYGKRPGPRDRFIT